MERVVETALGLVDRDGLSRLSMRKLGAELGVDPMAVYHYIPNKAALLDGLIEAVMNELGVAPARLDDESVEDWLVRVYTLFWHNLRAHPNVLTVMATRPLTGDSAMRSAERILQELIDLGVPADEAMGVLLAITQMTISLALAEASRNPDHMDPKVSEKIRACYLALPPDEFPLFLAGLEHKLVSDWSQIFEITIRVFVAGLSGTYRAVNAKSAAWAEARAAD